MRTLHSFLSSTFTSTAAAILITAALTFLLLFTRRRSPARPTLSHEASERDRKLPAAFILQNQVTHARILPEEATHGFTYPAMFFLVSLNALESHNLDCVGGWLFGYGGVSLRVTGLRSSAYVYADEGSPLSIKQKLVKLLVGHGIALEDGNLEDAWMLTMPSYLGYEGINPLTVYFCYRKNADKPWAIVLEVHNTFGERHAYVLQVGIKEDSEPANGFDHQWTFAREFHVSPFNDRSGSYVVSVTLPQCSPFSLSNTTYAGKSADLLHPRIRIHLLTSTNASLEHSGSLKLSAVMRPTSLVPFTSVNLATLTIQYPFLLFLSLPRILYHAWILHYRKGLPVYPRPEPYPAVHPEHSLAECRTMSRGGIGWQRETRMQRIARRCLHEFLEARVEEARVQVTLVSGNPLVPRSTFTYSGAQSYDDPGRTLTISYLSPAFFSIMLEAPSGRHALLFGKASQLFSPSSEELFLSVFSQPPIPTRDSQLSITQQIRLQLLPQHLRHHTDLYVPTVHLLDLHTTSIAYIGTLVYLLSAFARDFVEKSFYNVFRVRFVTGQEPWCQWNAIATHM